MLQEFKLARGVLFRQVNHDKTVLLMKDSRPGKKHFFLPGGQVKPGHPIADSLVDQWEKELKWNIELDQFLGCVEHKWSYMADSDEDEKVDVYEINFLFKVQLPDAKEIKQEPTPRYDYISYHWVPLKDLLKYNLHPAPFKAVILEYHFKQYSSVWTTTIK